MFTALLIHSGSSRAHILRYLVAATECLEVVRDFDRVPSEHELKRTMGAQDPEVIVVDLGEVSALAVASQVRDVKPDAAILGFGPTLETAMAAQKLGYDEVLPDSAQPEELREAVQLCLRKQRGGVEKNLSCFLPGKAGCGASTIVMNTATALARDHNKRVLVIDADLRSGVQSILLATEPHRSLQSVLENINRIDRRNFDGCVHRAQGVDYLLSTRSVDSTPPDWASYFHLLKTVEGMYDAILVDMPELVNPATFELVRRAEHVFVVCTPEIPAMTLSRSRLEELRRIEIPRNRTSLLLNRWHKSDPSPEEVSKLVGQEIFKVFPNDYPGLRSAILSGRPVAATSKLGGAFTEFAGELLGITRSQSNSLTGKLKSLWGIKETVHAS
jgi:pilus assembly protein CpaE